MKVKQKQMYVEGGRVQQNIAVNKYLHCRDVQQYQSLLSAITSYTSWTENASAVSTSVHLQSLSHTHTHTPKAITLKR